MTKPVTDDTFEHDVLNASAPVVVDFWAEWCGPCRMIGPSLEELSQDMAGKVEILKLNIDENPGIPAKYGVRGIPTLMMFKNGEVIATQVGALLKSGLKAWIEKNA
jgi:thioredoxin 1